jgi:hypothetical protein
MINELIKLANSLDNKGLKKEADYVDNIISKFSNQEKKMLVLHTMAYGIPHNNEALKNAMKQSFRTITNNVYVGANSVSVPNLAIHNVAEQSSSDLDKLQDNNTATASGLALGYDFVLLTEIYYNEPYGDGHSWQLSASIKDTETKGEITQPISYVVYTKGTSLGALRMKATDIASRITESVSREMSVQPSQDEQQNEQPPPMQPLPKLNFE